MSGTKIQARHVFQGESGAAEREVWGEATGEPCFHWGGNREASWRSIAAVQSRFTEWVEAHGGAEALTFYHDGAGADVLAAWDPSPHKVLAMHRWPPRWERYCDWHIRYTGRLAVAGQDLREAVRERFAWIPERYVHVFPTPEATETPRERFQRKTLIWLWGQSWKACGNRLRAALDHWGGQGQAVLIIGGEGAHPAWAAGSLVEWQSGLTFRDALEQASTCDSVLLLSDFALQAPWLKAWVRRGMFVLLPDGDSPSRCGEWLDASAPRPYDWGDMEAAIVLLQSWRSATERERSAYREWAERSLSLGERNDFWSEWEHFKATLWHQKAPRIGIHKARRSLVPVGWYNRVDRLRRGE